MNRYKQWIIFFGAAFFILSPTFAHSATKQKTVQWLNNQNLPSAVSASLKDRYGEDGLASIRKGDADIGLVDLDEQPASGSSSDEIIVAWKDGSYCGSGGCSISILRHQRSGKYIEVGGEQGLGKETFRLGDKYTNGMLDISISNNLFVWDGVRYRLRADYQEELAKVKPADMPVCKLVSAIFIGDLDTASGLLDSGAHVNGTCKGVPPLVYAAQSGQFEMVRLLLERGSRADVRDPNGVTPLGHATQERKTKIMQLLLAKGADPNSADSRGKRPLHNAANPGDIADIDTVRTLLDGGADVNAKDHEGNTPTVAALTSVYPSYIAVLRLLLDRGADPNSANLRGATALMIASSLGKVDAVKLLLDKGAKIDAKMNSGDTALMLAEKSGKVQVAKLLRERGAKLPATTASNPASSDDKTGKIIADMSLQAAPGKPMMLRPDGKVSYPPGMKAHVRLLAQSGNRMLDTTLVASFKEKRGSAELFETKDKVVIAGIQNRFVMPVVSRKRAAECDNQPSDESVNDRLIRLWCKQHISELRAMAANAAARKPEEVKATCSLMESVPNIAAEEAFLAFAKHENAAAAQAAKKSLGIWRARWAKMLGTAR